MALLLSIIALVAGSRSSDRSLYKRVSGLSMQHSGLAESLELLTLQLRNLRSRLNMTSRRDKNNSETSSAEPKGNSEELNEQWARDMNLKIARGEVKPWSR